MYDVAIIGCGGIGAAAAYALSRYDNKVVILEAENDVADCTTKANSAILHAGYDPAPGTRMARLNVRGVALAKELCAKLDVSYKQCGSLVLALDEKELPHLQHLFENGTANGVPDMKILSKEEALAMEPNLSEKVCGALWAPSAAIVNPWEYALAMTEVAVRNGVELRRSCKVTNAEAIEGGSRLTVPGGTVETRCVINAAGIWADKVHSMVEPANFHIIPTRGEYYLLDKSEGTRVSHVIFQCPNELGKGVLVAPTVHGNLLVGPNAEPVEGNDTSCTSSGLEFVKATAQRSVPSINFGESIRRLKEQGVFVYCADMDGVSLRKNNLTGPIALVLGSEGSGVSQLVKKLCDGVVRLDMAAPGTGVDSYNVSVAAGIILYEIQSQRGAQQG